MIERLRKMKNYFVGIFCFVLVFLLYVLDFKTGDFIDFSILYFLPIAVVTWFVGKKSGLIFGLISTTAWLYSEWSIGAQYRQTHHLPINGLFVLVAYLLIVELLSKFKKEILKSMEQESKAKEGEIIIKVIQSICGIIAENVASHNSEIIKWVNRKKDSGHQVSEVIEQSSLVIGQNIKKLNEISFCDEQMNLNSSNLSEYLNDLQQKIKNED
jgi:hypothetical protein